MWRSFSTVYGWDPIVSRESAVHAPDALASRLGLFVLWVYPQIEGRLTKDAKPSSVFNNYPGAISRILKRDFSCTTSSGQPASRSAMASQMRKECQDRVEAIPSPKSAAMS